MACAESIFRKSYVEVAFFQAEWGHTSCVLFHPFENLLVAADNRHTIGYLGDLALERTAK